MEPKSFPIQAKAAELLGGQGDEVLRVHPQEL